MFVILYVFNATRDKIEFFDWVKIKLFKVLTNHSYLLTDILFMCWVKSVVVMYVSFFFLKEDKGLDLEYKILRLNTSDCTKMFDFFMVVIFLSFF